MHAYEFVHMYRHAYVHVSVQVHLLVLVLVIPDSDAYAAAACMHMDGQMHIYAPPELVTAYLGWMAAADVNGIGSGAYRYMNVCMHVAGMRADAGGIADANADADADADAGTT